MLTQVEIRNTVTQAKFYTETLLAQIAELQANGDNVTDYRKKFIVFMEWIRILEEYMDFNYDQDGNITTPVFECITADQAADVMAKLQKIYCNNTVQLSEWILADGVWDDNGNWDDSAFWNDSPLF